MEITQRNFSENFEDIRNNLKTSCFVGFDAEFTGILTGEAYKYRYLIFLEYFFIHNIDH